eukprot:10064-Eustigmatos_ZCMA.PRE.1
MVDATAWRTASVLVPYATLLHIGFAMWMYSAPEIYGSHVRRRSGSICHATYWSEVGRLVTADCLCTSMVRALRCRISLA